MDFFSHGILEYCDPDRVGFISGLQTPTSVMDDFATVGSIEDLESVGERKRTFEARGS